MLVTIIQLTVSTCRFIKSSISFGLLTLSTCPISNARIVVFLAFDMLCLLPVLRKSIKEKPAMRGLTRYWFLSFALLLLRVHFPFALIRIHTNEHCSGIYLRHHYNSSVFSISLTVPILWMIPNLRGPGQCESLSNSAVLKPLFLDPEISK